MQIDIPYLVRKSLDRFFSRRDPNNTIAIYSTGGLTKAAFKTGLIGNKRISTIFDRNSEFWGQTIDGVPIVPITHLSRDQYTRVENAVKYRFTKPREIL